MRLQEIREKSIEELHQLVKEWREQLRDARFKAAQRQLKNIRTIRDLRKRVSRALTELRARAAK